MTLFRVSVTFDDMRDGARRDCLDCPVARGCQRATGLVCGVDGVTVKVYQAGINGRYVTAYLPVFVRDWVRAFDRSFARLAIPVEFTLRVPAFPWAPDCPAAERSPVPADG